MEAARRLRPPRSIRPTPARSDGTDIVFKWEVPSDPDGGKIADYQFELVRPARYALAAVDELSTS